MTPGAFLAGARTRLWQALGPLDLARSFAAALLAMGVLGAVQAAEYVGLVHPLSDVQMSVPVAGVVQRVLVKPGQWVREGQALLELDSTVQQLELRRRGIIVEDESELAASRARVEVMTELQRMMESVANTTASISREELLKQRLETVSANGRLVQLQTQKRREQVEFDQAKSDLGQRTLRAPVAGMVVDAPLEVGEWAKPGDNVLRIVDATNVELRFSLPLEALAAVRVGSRLSAGFESGRGLITAEGQVQFVSPVADPASGLSEVRAVFANPRGLLRPGVKGILKLPGAQRPN
jgi:RND family efflux transporter MFP subunit